MFTLQKGKQHAVAFDTTNITSATNRSNPQPGDPCHTLAKGAHPPMIAYGGNNTAGPIDVATAVNAHGGGSGRMDFESETFVCVDLTNGREVKGCANTIDKSIDKQNRGQAILHIRPGNTRESPGATRADDLAHTLRASGFDGSEDGSGRGTPLVPMDDIAFNPQAAGNQTTLGANTESTGAVNRSQVAGVAGVAGVRRLMPIETERLQGFPDGWTEGFADGPRYAMCGNAVATPCAEWLGMRILRSLSK